MFVNWLFKKMNILWVKKFSDTKLIAGYPLTNGESSNASPTSLERKRIPPVTYPVHDIFRGVPLSCLGGYAHPVWGTPILSRGYPYPVRGYPYLVQGVPQSYDLTGVPIPGYMTDWGTPWKGGNRDLGTLPPWTDRQMPVSCKTVKTLPSRRTTYAGGNNLPGWRQSNFSSNQYVTNLCSDPDLILIWSYSDSILFLIW